MVKSLLMSFLLPMDIYFGLSLSGGLDILWSSLLL